MSLNSIPLLQLLLGRAEAERNTAAGVLRQAELAEQAAQTQARDLQDYRSSYDQRWTTHFRSTGTTTLLHCHHGFGQRLDQAITVQTRNTGHLGNRVQQARGVLLLREQRVAAVRKLIERRQAEVQAQTDRRDQRSSDDAALRARSVSAAQGLPRHPSGCAAPPALLP